MTDAEIAAIVQRSDLQSCACGSDVRALAAECERLQAFEAATADASSRSARAKATMYANMRIEIESLRAQLEEWTSAAGHLAIAAGVYDPQVDVLDPERLNETKAKLIDLRNAYSDVFSESCGWQKLADVFELQLKAARKELDLLKNMNKDNK